MSRKKKASAEFRFYEIPNEEPVLALTGNKWIQVYGENINNLHFHNLLEIGYCYYGQGNLIIDDESYRFGTEMISCIPENVLHTTNSDAGIPAYWEYLYIDPVNMLKICQKSSQEIRDILAAVNARAFFVNAQEAPMIATLIRAILEEAKQEKEYHQECIRGMVYSLLFEIARFNGKKASRTIGGNGSLAFEKAIEYVEKNYANNFKIVDLAKECHMSETHFRRIFQEKMNMTPIEYVNFVRIRKACELIDKTDISMEDVALKVGFITPSTFNRNFRRIVGTSPYQWKKRPDNRERKLTEYKISALRGWGFLE